MGRLEGASLAKALGFPRISVTEFGVAGGRGLLALEKIAVPVETLLDLRGSTYRVSIPERVFPPHGLS